MRDFVQDSVWEKFPQFSRSIVIGNDLRITDHNDRIAAFLTEVLAQRQQEGAKLLQHPQLLAWDNAHRQFGSNPKRCPPSIRSLLERVLRGKSLPYINDCVALFNCISLKYLVPCGGDDLDAITGDLCLGFASGNEQFIPLGGSEGEHPDANEVIYFDSDLKVMARRWNWRNGDQTKITTATRRVLINIDGLGSDLRPVLDEAAREMADWLSTECAGRARCDILHPGRRVIEV